MTLDPDAEAIGDTLRAMFAKASAELVLEINANLVEACPVDTGNARANFVPSVAAAFDGSIQATGQVSTGAEQQAGISAVLGYRFGQGDLFITNHVPYIGRLIGGYSDQAPAGWDLVAIDAAVKTIQDRYDMLRIDVSSSLEISARGAYAAENVASAYSPFGD